MPSPFPGMNPYIEKPDLWPDFHDRWLVYAAAEIAAQARPNFVVLIGEHVFIHDPALDTTRQYLGDVTVTPSPGRDVNGTSTSLLTPPVKCVIPTDEPNRLTYLEVRDRRDHRVVTVIELLSPANKYAGRDRAQYEAKRNRLFVSEANYVEIDLLRGGPRMPLEDRPVCEYYALVSRPPDRPVADFWPIHLRDPLPVIPIPLAGNVPEARLDLQRMVHQVYDQAFYEDFIYHRPPEPRLSAEDAAWAEALVPKPA